jgi:hypothetical protein
MLPYTTYNIPENQEKPQPESGKWLWIIVDKNLSNEDKELLGKITSALKADFNDDAHCLQVEEEQSISLNEYFGRKPKLIISFGVSPSSLGLWVDLPKSGLLVLESYAFILSPTLEALSASNVAKKELWQSMKVFMASK